MYCSNFFCDILVVGVVSSVSSLIVLAFFTLFERNCIGEMNCRKGPNKVGVGGIMQPFGDAGKLVFKQRVSLIKFNFSGFLIAPLVALMLVLCLWVIYPNMFGGFSAGFSGVVFLVVSSLSVYSVMGAGWSSNSKYSLYGAIRGVAQSVSYEVSLALFLISIFLLVSGFSLFNAGYGQISIALVVIPFSALAWIGSCIAESNRAPFDFAEGESELVSGFNVEYSSSSFALIFMAEYASILIISLFSVVLFLCSGRLEYFLFKVLLGGIIVAFVYVGVRAALPRLRYDMLMSIAWKGFLPLSLSLLIYLVGFMCWLF